MVCLGLGRYPGLWLSSSILLGFHLLVGTVAALQEEIPNATNVLPDSIIVFMVCFFFFPSKENGVQKGKGKAIDLALRHLINSCKSFSSSQLICGGEIGSRNAGY